MTTTTGTAGTAAERPWVGEMIVVHRVFERESRLLPELIQAVPEGDVARAALLAGMVREYHDGLHSHHTGEDELLWPLLLARVDLEADLVLRMEQQHEVVAAGLHTIMELLPAWERAAHVLTRDALVAALHQHRQDLLVHLDEEERSILPLVAEHVTVAEWDALGERARSHTPKDKLLFMLGALLEDATPAERDRMLAHLPLPAKLAWFAFGRSSYRRRMRKIRGRRS